MGAFESVGNGGKGGNLPQQPHRWPIPPHLGLAAALPSLAFTVAHTSGNRRKGLLAARHTASVLIGH